MYLHAFARSVSGPAPPKGKQADESKQQARQSDRQQEFARYAERQGHLEIHLKQRCRRPEIASQRVADCQPHCKKKLG